MNDFFFFNTGHRIWTQVCLIPKTILFPVSYAVFLPSVNTSWAPTMHQALCWAQKRTKMSRKHCFSLREKNKSLPILPIFNSGAELLFFLFLAVLGLHCCMQALSSWERGYSLAVVHGLLIEVASLVAEHGLWCSQSAVVVTHRLICLVAYGIFPNQGWNPAMAGRLLTTGPPGKYRTCF